MSKEIYISTTPHETRLAIVESDALTEIYYERENEYTLAGSIYNGRVTRVLPGMQSSFVDIGLERDAFLYITDFMEEAGDSADFESGSADGRGKRESRGGERAPRRDAVSAAPSDEVEATPRVEGERSDRGGDRSGRRDRNGRRGGRDERSGNREGRATEPRVSSTADDASSDDVALESAPPAEGGFAPEGAPGADGSRRWRGRRGRRRGRGNGEATPAGEGTQQDTAADEGDSLEVAAPVMTDESPREATSSDRERGGREGRGGRDRGGRGNRDGRNDRDGRQESVRERFAPRGTRTASDDSESMDIQGSAEHGSPEPFILPGESLSKYRRNADGTPEQPVASAAAADTIIAAKPSYQVPAGWDGGSVLPGETLSRHRGKSSDTDSQRSTSYRPGRDESPRRNDRPARPALEPSEAVQPAVTSQHEPEAFETSEPSGVMTFEPSSTPLAEEVVEQETAAGSIAASEPIDAPEDSQFTEYEPGEDAAASFKVDPAAPSEFRQSAPAEEVEPEPQAEAALPEPVFHAEEEDAFVPSEPLDAQFTAIQDSGEMLSAPVHSEAHAESNGDSPVEHEEAVQSVSLHQAEMNATTPAQPQKFAPGDGQLEEELLDDEDNDPLSLQASSIYEDMEEETLEGAADLGTMIRDMSIDQMTRPAAADEHDEDDDFDIDEEDLEEDEFDNGEEESEDESSEEDEFADAEQSGEIEDREEEEGQEAAERSARPAVEGEADRGGDRRPRRDGGRRGGRDRGSRDRRPSSGRPSQSGGGGGDRRPSRHSAQTTNLPAISDLLKPGQELLVQIAKEPIAKKGARITSHIALPGRFLVFMPTVSHVGVSRKIESDGERRRLKEILLSEKGDASGGFIVRTAAANASEDELRSDLRFLLNLWADIKTRSESSKSPALIYHDLNLVERILRDQVTDNFSAIWVDTEDAYERVLRFLQRFQPSLIRRVKLYTKDTPLFEQFGITEEINKALRSKVWLKSGGSIVINQTEALVAIDINTGKFVGKTARLEDTIVKTNLDAIPEIVRQIRLRDLGGIIIIDFIDMDERKNRHKVMAALEEELKSDRAPSKVLQFNDFGLVAITRKRVKQSLERTLSTTCGVCQGTGMVKSPVTVCNDIYIEMRKMQKHLDRGDVMLRVNPEVVKQLKSPGAKWLQEMEEMIGRTILVKSDPSLHPEQFDLH